jgi:tetratricopeptide (TPR) repeat protein
MSRTRVLFLAANPIKKNILSLDEEIRAINEKIRMSDHRDSLDLISAWAVRPDDLLQMLNQHKPHIVHFSGHGSSDGNIVLVDNNRNPQSVSAGVLQKLFSTLKDNIQLVVLNACYSKIQAEAITKVIDCAIGMNASFADDSAIVFAGSVYRAIGFGRSIKEAFEQGLVAVSLNSLKGEDTAELITRSGVDPGRIILVTQPERIESPDTGSQAMTNSAGSIQAGRDLIINRIGPDPPDGREHYTQGLRYLRQKLYDLAIPSFLKALELMPENADAYYYLALALIRGARPKTLLHNDAKQIEKYLSTAIRLGAKAKHYYLAAILNYDYYASNGLSIPEPNFEQLLRSAAVVRKEPDEIELMLNNIVLRDEALIAFIKQNST